MFAEIPAATSVIERLERELFVRRREQDANPGNIGLIYVCCYPERYPEQKLRMAVASKLLI